MSYKTMTDGEVVTSFRQAKDKREQIGILADLNLCRKDDILNILAAAGEDVTEYISGVRKRATPTKYKRWSSDDITILEEGCKNGGSCEEIAAALGRTVDSVYAKASEMGFVSAAGGTATESAAKKKKGIHRWTDADDEALIELRGEGKSSRAIAEALGCSRQNVDLHIAKLKKEGRLPGGTSEKTKPRKSITNEDFNKCFDEVPTKESENTSVTPETDDDHVLGGMLDMLCRMVAAMKKEPRRVHMDIPGDDLSKLVMDFSECQISVIM